MPAKFCFIGTPVTGSRRAVASRVGVVVYTKMAPYDLVPHLQLRRQNKCWVVWIADRAVVPCAIFWHLSNAAAAKRRYLPTLLAGAGAESPPVC